MNTLKKQLSKLSSVTSPIRLLSKKQKINKIRNRQTDCAHDSKPW